MSVNLARQRRTRAAAPQNLPFPLAHEVELVAVDITWGTVQPLQPFPDVPTVGELEIIDLVARGAVLVDTRVGDSRSGTTLPGAVHLPHDQIADRRSELDGSKVSILFCNGPQCPQTPDAIGALLDAGHLPAALAYYRGGLHDWVTLGYPTESV
jgi:rhodanese-related sulfurtransferase